MGSARGLYEIDILGIAQRPREQEFVNRRATPKRNPALQVRSVEQIAERATDNEVLFYLPQVGPRSLYPPRLNIRPGDQASTSTDSLIMSFHLEFFSRGSTRDATRGVVTAGFNGTTVFAFLTNGSSTLA